MSETDGFAGVTWHSAGKIGVKGQGWAKESAEFTRLPDRAKERIPEGVWNLSRHAAGLYMDFKTDAETIFCRFKLPLPRAQGAFETCLMSEGLDLYGKDKLGRWRWVGQQAPWREGDALQDGKFNGLPLDGESRTYRVYLPLRSNIADLEIGVRGESSFEPLREDVSVVVYGTSIVHGMSASRPGMTWAAQMARGLDVDQITLGFAGRAKMEPELAEFLGELPGKVFVLDCLPNMDAAMIEERMPVFMRKLRDLKPESPLLLIGDRMFGDAAFLPERHALKERKDRAQRKVFAQLENEGMEKIHLLQHPSFFGEDFEGTVDGSHPTDLGAWRMQSVVTPVVERLLRGSA